MRYRKLFITYLILTYKLTLNLFLGFTIYKVDSLKAHDLHRHIIFILKNIVDVKYFVNSLAFIMRSACAYFPLKVN